MSWFIFTRDISANLSLFSKKKKKLLQLRQNDPFSVQKLGHILNLTQKIEKLYLFIYIFNYIYIIKKKKKKKLIKAVCEQERASTFPSYEIMKSYIFYYYYYYFLFWFVYYYFFDKYEKHR